MRKDFNSSTKSKVLIGRERPTLCSDAWSLGAVLLQWMLERAPWDLHQLCDQYQYRHDKQVSTTRCPKNNVPLAEVLPSSKGTFFPGHPVGVKYSQ